MPQSDLAKQLQEELIRKQHLVEMLSTPNAEGKLPVMILRGEDGQDHDVAAETLSEARTAVAKIQTALSLLTKQTSSKAS